MGRAKGWGAAATRRSPLRSPGRPPVWRREHRQGFWDAIEAGARSEDAAAAVGLSQAVGTRWFREAGGMRTVSRSPLSGRYLSHSADDLAAVAATLNSRPRKTLDWRTPAEALNEYLQSSQQTGVAMTG